MTTGLLPVKVKLKEASDVVDELRELPKPLLGV